MGTVIWGILIIALVLVVLNRIIAKVASSPKRKKVKPLGPPAYDPARTRADLGQLIANDPGFSEQMFIARVNNIFMQMQEAWEHRDWKKVRPFESNKLFAAHFMKLEELTILKRTNIISEIAILNTMIVRYYSQFHTENLEVYLRTRFKDYVIDDETREVVDGDPDLLSYIEYLLVMTRKEGVRTKPVQDTEVTSCPNCGANVSINTDGECDYCGSMVINGEFDWVLSRMDVISEK